MTRPVRVSEPAAAELTEAIRWYERQRAGLGAELLETMDAALALVGDHPEIGSVVPGATSVRRLLLRRFPYWVVYRISGDAIVVVALAHTRRRPNYWRDRT